jgi:peptidyl-prolyl cis-trans isomerase B (cyclophilin B)
MIGRFLIDSFYHADNDSGTMADAQGTTSKLAIAATICGFLGIFLAVPMIAAIIMGHLALSEVKKNPLLKGRGMAISALAVGYAWIAMVIVCVIIAVSTSLSGRH